MNNSNDNTEISSNNSPSAGPSNAVESSTNECNAKLTTANSNEAGNKISISKILTTERTHENQNNRLISKRDSVNITEERNTFINQNAEENSTSECSSTPGTSGSEIIERVCVTNLAVSSTANDNVELNNRDIVTIKASVYETRNNSSENQENIVNESNHRNIANEVNVNPINQNVENNAAVSENRILAGVSNNERDSPQDDEHQNTNRSAVQERPHRTNQTIASFPRPQQENASGCIINASTSTRSGTNSTPYHHTVISAKAQRCYRALSGRVNSSIEVNITPPPVPPRVIQRPPPLAGAPPSYSAVMRLGPVEDPPLQCTARPPARIQPSPPFIAPVPPPSYAEVQGYHIERPAFVASVDQMVWGPDPLSVVCPRCANVIVTSTHTQRSNLTHFSALALCLCGCWPCCLLPYCMDSCKNTYHHCPSCQQLLGMYRPW